VPTCGGAPRSRDAATYAPSTSRASAGTHRRWVTAPGIWTFLSSLWEPVSRQPARRAESGGPPLSGDTFGDPLDAGDGATSKSVAASWRGHERMRPKPTHGLRALTLTAVTLALIAACGDPSRPAPRDEGSLAPYVASPEMIVEEMLRLASVGKDDVVYDLGPGTDGLSSWPPRSTAPGRRLRIRRDSSASPSRTLAGPASRTWWNSASKTS